MTIGRTHAGSAAFAAALLVCVLLPGSTASGRAGRDRPLPRHTGGFGEPTCQACHFQADVNAGTGTLALDGLPAKYDAGAAYALTLTLAQNALGAGGFQMSARFGDGTQAGSLTPATNDTARVDVTTSEGVQYIHHVHAGSQRMAPDTARWHVVWSAPSSGGTVHFHIAANAADDDESPLGDLIYATSFRVSPR